jgi:hypothetical protein
MSRWRSRSKDTNKAYIRKRSKPDVHVPNQLEAKVLRKLMSKTGLTEEEIREIPSYRKLLSESQKPKPALKKRVPFFLGKPKWNNSKSDKDQNKFSVGTVVLSKNRSKEENYDYPSRDVWIITSSIYEKLPINDHMYTERWELELKNFLDNSWKITRMFSTDFDIVEKSIVEKWKAKLTYKKFGL